MCCNSLFTSPLEGEVGAERREGGVRAADKRNVRSTGKGLRRMRDPAAFGTSMGPLPALHHADPDRTASGAMERTRYFRNSHSRPILTRGTPSYSTTSAVA